MSTIFHIHAIVWLCLTKFILKGGDDILPFRNLRATNFSFIWSKIIIAVIFSLVTVFWSKVWLSGTLKFYPVWKGDCSYLKFKMRVTAGCAYFVHAASLLLWYLWNPSLLVNSWTMELVWTYFGAKSLKNLHTLSHNIIFDELFGDLGCILCKTFKDH